jgi:LPXTG-motif cell wall-anchored protein
MTRIIAIVLVLVAAMALPAGTVWAQGEEGYTEEQPPNVGGGGSGDGTDTGTGTATGTGAATGTGTAAGEVAGAAGTTAGTAGAGSGTAGSGGQLPATGSETGILAAIGAAMLAGGFALRRTARAS